MYNISQENGGNFSTQVLPDLSTILRKDFFLCLALSQELCSLLFTDKITLYNQNQMYKVVLLL